MKGEIGSIVEKSFEGIVEKDVGRIVEREFERSVERIVKENIGSIVEKSVEGIVEKDVVRTVERHFERRFRRIVEGDVGGITNRNVDKSGEGIRKNSPAITGPTGTKLYSPPVLRISLKWAPTPAEPGRCEQDRGWVRRAWEPG